MQIPQESLSLKFRSVTLEMMTLMAYALLMGVVVSVLVAVPVLLLTVTAS